MWLRWRATQRLSLMTWRSEPFSDDGKMLPCGLLPDDIRKMLRLTGALRVKPDAKIADYLDFHREYVARDLPSQ